MDVFQVVIGLAQIALMWWFGAKQMSLVKATETANEEVKRRIRFRYWPLAGMAILVIAAWIPYFLRLGEPSRVMAMTLWTVSKDGCDVVIDGAKLIQYEGKYNVAVACGFSSPKIDQFQDGLIAVSSPFTIVPGSIPIEAPFTPQMLEHIKEATTANPPQALSVWDMVILMPKSEDISRVKKLSDVRTIGGKIVKNCENIE